MKNAQIPFQITSLESVNDVFESKWHELLQTSPEIQFSRQTYFDVKTAFYEAVVNTIKHAQELKKYDYVSGKLFLNYRTIGFEVRDHGSGFDLEKVPIPNFYDMASSGRGVFMMKQMGDELKYRKGKTHNVLTFKRYLVGQNASAKEIDLIYNISEAVIRGTSLHEVYQMILDQALDIFKAERASILIYDEKLKRLRVIASRGLSKDVIAKIQVRVGEGVSGYVFQHGRPLLVEDITENKRGIEKKKGYKSHSFISAPMICSPLRKDEKPLGVINLTDRADGKKFTKKDLTVLSTLANQAMAGLYIRGLVDEVKRSEVLKQEFDIIRQIQSSYLPKQMPHLPNFDVFGDCEMAQSVGGDYYDYQIVEPYLYLIVADVSGHDIKSAMTMLNFRSQLQVLVAQKKSPEKILEFLNKTLNDDLMQSMHFVSCLLMRIESRTGQFELASAGHYPPLFFNGQTHVMPAGLVLGVDPEEKYETFSGQLKKGEGFLLFTDGVVEAMNAKSQFFGMKKLKAFLKSHAKDSSQALVQDLMEKVMGFRSAGSPLDDITALALRYV